MYNDPNMKKLSHLVVVLVPDLLEQDDVVVAEGENLLEGLEAMTAIL